MFDQSCSSQVEQYFQQYCDQIDLMMIKLRKVLGIVEMDAVADFDQHYQQQ